MTSLVVRKPYTDDELRKLYPPGLELRQVQVLMRHGERTPVSARFQNAGLSPWWPYCSIARQMRAAVLAPDAADADANADADAAGAAAGRRFDTLRWRRRLETFGDHDEPVLARGPDGRADNICDFGSLTDLGFRSTYQLGQRLRQLYVHRLGFLPATLTSTDFLYLRSTGVPRALESLHQTFSALYPPSARAPGPDGKLPTPTIITRVHSDETLYPNDGNCRRFAALSRAFAQRTADRWNGSSDMEYLQRLYGKWMPSGTKVAVDSRPRLSGIMDTVNATLAHGPETRLPKEFYDEKGREIMENICVEEWFAGYKESKEFRMLGIGGLLGDIVGRMVDNVEHQAAGATGRQKPENAPIRFGLSGCHDTTLAGVLASLGAYDTGRWPPFTSHMAIELFRESKTLSPPQEPAKASWWSSLFGAAAPPATIGRRPVAELSPAEKSKLDGYYVRIRYNDEPVTVPACKLPGNHLEGDESFCTLAAFKAVVDKFTPTNWKQQCRMNLDQPALPAEPEWAGH
ncbi:e441dff3-f720-4cd3-aba0-768241b31936 [Thermothielavioides terrestris]|uniref:3-phytase n=1 Tax=Thermothielavioides terrestris TaxID=2587410 RepID=A0A446BU13_9PEZI|nr:e441dff3-f720-4cd3-aba0-768241b31936 [Thermothielavioides terrestris]